MKRTASGIFFFCCLASFAVWKNKEVYAVELKTHNGTAFTNFQQTQ